MGIIESVSAIGKYPEVSCGESTLASQMASAWSDHVGEMLGMSWFTMAFLTSVAIPGMIPLMVNLPFLCGLLSMGHHLVGRTLDEAKEVPEHTLRLLVFG